MLDLYLASADRSIRASLKPSLGLARWLPVLAPAPCYSYTFYRLTPFFPAFALCTFQEFLEHSLNVLSFILLTKSSSFSKDKFKSYEQIDSPKSTFLPLRSCITSYMFPLTSCVTEYTLTYQSLPLVL